MIRFVIVLSVIAIAVALPLLFWGDRLDLMLTRDGAVQWLADYGRFAWLAGIGLLVADLALPIPSAAVMAALGMVYGSILGGLVASVGSVVSGLIGYALCRHLGRPCALWLSGKRALATGERVFSKSGGWVVALSRWLPILSEIVACLAGLSRMRFAPFLGALLCGSIPLGFIFATIGHVGEGRPILTLALAAVLPLFLWAALRPVFRDRMPDM